MKSKNNTNETVHINPNSAFDQQYIYLHISLINWKP